jgi:hypothetical protein
MDTLMGSNFIVDSLSDMGIQMGGALEKMESWEYDRISLSQDT